MSIRDYSFFSGLHELHVRLDAFLCSPDIHASVQGVEYLARTISDHNPVIMSLGWNRVSSCIPTWRLKPEALEDRVFCDTVRENIQQYFEMNNERLLRYL